MFLKRARAQSTRQYYRLEASLCKFAWVCVRSEAPSLGEEKYRKLTVHKKIKIRMKEK